jgi:hypothetical protein
MTRIRWIDLGEGERAAVVPDVDSCTSRYVVERPGEPTSLHRTTSPPETPRIAFRVVRNCPCCDRQMIVTRYEDERVIVEEFYEEEQP